AAIGPAWTRSRIGSILRKYLPRGMLLGNSGKRGPGSHPRAAGPTAVRRREGRSWRPMLSLNFGSAADAALRVLCLGAHSDDIEIGCGGTLLTLLDRYANVSVHWVVLGAAGDRAEEARASAFEFLNQAREREVVVKDYRDGFFPFHGQQIKE